MKLFSCDPSCLPAGWFLPPLSPRPPFHPGGVERGSEQPHLVSSLRLGHHWDTFLLLSQWRRLIISAYFLPPLSPQPPFHPGGVERGSEQPHLISSQRPRHHRPLLLCAKRRGCCASRRLAGATKSNVDLAPLSRPVGRERGWGRGWGNSSACGERSTSGVNIFSRQGYHSHVESNNGDKKHA